MTSYITCEVRRVGSATGFLLKDGLGSVRFESQTGGTSSLAQLRPLRHAVQRQRPDGANGRGYINERLTPKRGCNICMQGITTPTLGGSSPPAPCIQTIPGVDINRYAYAGNDPVNQSDRNGHHWLQGGNSNSWRDRGGTLHNHDRSEGWIN